MTARSRSGCLRGGHLLSGCGSSRTVCGIRIVTARLIEETYVRLQSTRERITSSLHFVSKVLRGGFLGVGL